MSTLAELQIAADHPAFAGHFPGTPIVPGAVLLDEALFAMAASLRISVDRCTLTTVKFRSNARPGEPLLLRFDSPSPGSVHFAIESADRTVAEGVLSLNMVAPVHGR